MAKNLSEREFERTLQAIQEFRPSMRATFPYSINEQLRWLNVRGIRLKLRVGYREIARAILRINGNSNRLLPAYKLFSPALLTQIVAIVAEENPTSVSDWKRRMRLHAVMESLLERSHLGDEADEFVDRYRFAISVAREKIFRNRLRYSKRYRSNFWLDETGS